MTKYYHDLTKFFYLIYPAAPPPLFHHDQLELSEYDGAWYPGNH